MKSLRRFGRHVLNAVLAPRWLNLTAARIARPVLRAVVGTSLFKPAWKIAELTINAHNHRAQARSWFGARFNCNLREIIDGRIFYTGVWEPDVTRLFVERIRPGDTIIDAGANIGYFTALAASLTGPTGRVVAIEGWPPLTTALERMVETNRLTNVTVKAIAIAATRGTITLYAGATGNVGATSIVRDPASTAAYVVAADTLLGIIAPADLAKASLIKIDIESAEAPVLRALLDNADLLPRRCAIIAEVTADAFPADWTVQQLIEDFASHGFANAIVRNDYVFDEQYWRFDATAPAARLDRDAQRDNRFDLLLSRDH